MSRGSDPYENLANAIVLSAVKDYREANKKLARGRKNTEAQRTHHPPLVLDEPNSAGFCTEHSAKSRSIGYEEELSPAAFWSHFPPSELTKRNSRRFCRPSTEA